MKRRWHRLVPALVVLMVMGAGWLLYHELRHFRIRDIRQAFEQFPAWRLWAAAGLMVVNYLVLIGYDYLAVRAIRQRLPLGKIALASFTGFVTSYNFGALLGGTSVRYRLYSLWGLSAVEIFQLVVMLGLTFWIGICTLAGIFFVVQPFDIPDRLPFPFATVRPLGFILLVLTGGYVGLTAVRKAPLRLRDLEMTLPGTGITVLQLAVAALDLMVAAACLYVLLAHDLTIGYGKFLGMYLFAAVVAVMTHVPGGVGVFELIVLTLSAPQSSATMVAALLAFRVIYYLLPMLLAAVLLAANEIVLRRLLPERLWSDMGRWAGTLAPPLLAWVTFMAGAVLLWSGSTPVLQTRLGPLEHTIPLPLVEVSHFVGSLAGAGLLLLARGLHRRLDSAWWLTIGVLGLGIVASLLKGLDYEEAVLLSILLLTLIACRRRFYRRGSLLHERFTPAWVGAIVLALFCSIWLGLFAYKHVEYTSELWWTFAFRGHAPRFLRASVGAATVLLLFAIRKMLTAHEPTPCHPTSTEVEQVQSIVQRSPHTSANLALLGDKSFLFNPEGTAFIMYAIQGRSWVAMGDPVGPDAEHTELVWRFREWVDRYDGWPVFYQVKEENLSIYLDQGLRLLKLGEEGRVWLPTFNVQGGTHKGLRYAQNRCRHENCQFDVIPADQVAPQLLDLRRISDAWLGTKHAVEKGFSLGFFDTDYVQRYPCAVVRQNARPIAFANIWCTAQREELAVDLMRYVPGAPAGLMDYLFTELILWGKEQGFQWFNLGMAPLSGIENRPLAPYWNRAVNLVFRHGEHFYNFEGLRKYKEKFNPTWRPKYLAVPGGLLLPRLLADVASLIAKRREVPVG